jgi:hypothetical protein
MGDVLRLASIFLIIEFVCKTEIPLNHEAAYYWRLRLRTAIAPNLGNKEGLPRAGNFGNPNRNNAAIERAFRRQSFLGCNLLYWMATAA